jgi:hypothetical protein
MKSAVPMENRDAGYIGSRFCKIATVGQLLTGIPTSTYAGAFSNFITSCRCVWKVGEAARSSRFGVVTGIGSSVTLLLPVRNP